MIAQGLPWNHLPFEEPVAVFALAMVIFLVAPLLLKQFDLPGIIAVLLVGVIVGPHGLGLLRETGTIELLGRAGLLYLMFVSGLEIDLNDFIDNPSRTALFALITFSLPMIIGVVSGVSLLGFSVVAAILFASIFSSHTLLGYPIVERLGIVKNEAITTTISATIITDTVALLILTVIETVHSQSHVSVLFWAQFGLKLTVFFGGVILIVPRIGRWFFRNVDEESYFEFLFAMAVLFVTAFLAQLVGAEPIIGAFLAGITINRLVPSASTLMNRINFVGNAFFIPFFLLSTGMIVQPSLFLQRVQPWWIAGILLGVMLGMKFTAAWITGRIYEYERAEWLTMFGLSTGQASAALAVATIGVEIGLFGPPTAIINGVVFMILVAGILSPYLSEKYGQAVVEHEEQQEYESSEAPQRILIPLTNYTDNTDTLLDFSMVLRKSGGDEPIRALTVVQREDQQLDLSDRYSGSALSAGDGSHDETDDQQEEKETDQQTEAEVAEAEDTLEETEEHAVSAEVPLETQTRIVDTSIAGGIARAIEENRITTVLIGWNNQRRFGQRLFGNTTDQLLQQTDKLVILANLSQPINTMKRIVVVLPGRIAAHPGFYEGIHHVHLVTEQLGIPVHYIVVGGEQEQYDRLIDSVEPDASFEIETSSSWQVFRSETDQRFEEGDILWALTPREGRRGWESALSALPQQLASTVAGNVSIVYLPEDSHARSHRFLTES